jgi:large subunit ribosomal protein L21
MYAIISTGGRQAKVAPGDVISVDRIDGVGDNVSFTPLLVVGDDGTPITASDVLSSATVTAEVLAADEKGPKIDIFTYKNKTGNRRRKGHRQRYTTVRVTAIDLPKE